MELLPTPGENALTTTGGGGIAPTPAVGPGPVDWSRPLGELVRGAVVAAGRSAHTRRQYATSLGQFWQYVGRATNAPGELAECTRDADGRSVWSYRGDARLVGRLSPSGVDGFRSWLQANGASPATVEIRFAAVKTFLSVCYRDGFLTDDHARRLDVRPFTPRRHRDRQPVGRRLTPDEVRRLRAAVDPATVKGRRDLAVVDCMLFAGLRRSEVAGLRVEDLRPDGGRHWLTVRGKGSKTRRVKVADPLFASLAGWFDAAGKRDGFVFEGLQHERLTGRQLTGSTVGRLVAEYGAAAGISAGAGPGVLSAHDLRRTFARNAYANGATLLAIRDALGHESVETTERYIGAGSDDTKTAVDFVRY